MSDAPDFRPFFNEEWKIVARSQEQTNGNETW